MRREMDIKKTVWTIVFIGCLQIIVLLILLLQACFLAWGRPLDPSGTTEIVLCILAIVSSTVMLSALPLIQRLYRQKQALTQAIGSVETLNRALRSQRHDFLNHLQVVHSLIEMKAYDDAYAYIADVYRDVQKLSGVLRTDHAAINAILQAKLDMCRSRSITVVVDIRSRLTHLPLPAWELCRVLGNIIDNAITAMERCREEKRLEITIGESAGRYVFSVANSGPAIEPAIRERIFEPGFTTRRGEGHGYGLSICREIMDGCGGTLRMFSDGRLTVFEGTMPRKTPGPLPIQTRK